MRYSTLEQRMAKGMLDQFPPFLPEENAPVAAEGQKVFYDLMKRLYQLAYDKPEMFVAALHEDDAYPNRYSKVSYGKPELLTNMKKFIKTVDSLVEKMFHAGQGEAVKLSKREKAVLAELGLADLAQLPAACTWMAQREEASLNRFARCFFQKDLGSYAMAIYASLIGEEPFTRLVSWLAQSGYQPHVFTDITASDCKCSLTFYNPAWSPKAPSAGFEYKMLHTGISLRYDAYIQKPCVLGLCIPNGMKPFLERFGEMKPELQAFVAETTKKCDGCRYCVQTDKTGARPLACIGVAYGAQTLPLCPYFPGFSYCWTELNDVLVDQIILFLGFMDRCKGGK